MTKPARRLPPWFKVRAKTGPGFLSVRKTLKKGGLGTVCESANCPNIWECWNSGTATFMILGDICTRRCAFCSVTKGHPSTVAPGEPGRLAGAAAELTIRHVVITSVTRDDIPDGGASVFAACVAEVKKRSPGCTIEVLVPDFAGRRESLNRVIASKPDVFNHNLETVKSLYPSIRPVASYRRSLGMLKAAAGAGLRTKSGIMVGLGEEPGEVEELMNDLARVHCGILTIGQYLSPSRAHRPVSRFYAGGIRFPCGCGDGCGDREGAFGAACPKFIPRGSSGTR
jgi:lipoic acid synthetase